ncbi:nuclear transport factor 2 family protein [Flavobacterium antarcticum]|uniref:nuclear transport factor 2 family protein n=1 Tax=Flavobacterium antarcticum TaxID=271155 RepID=UPI0003B3168D|nr:nuclear transport factor 2 family protein [Flavobacterium antarcticum]
MSQNLDTIAFKWFEAFNEHNLEKLLGLYDENAQHYSPKLKIKHPESNGLIAGKEALRLWWQDAFDRLPSLKYDVKSLTSNDYRVFMEYIRKVDGEPDLMVGELLTIESGKIVFSKVYHG